MSGLQSDSFSAIESGQKGKLAHNPKVYDLTKAVSIWSLEGSARSGRFGFIPARWPLGAATDVAREESASNRISPHENVRARTKQLRPGCRYL